MDGDTSLALPNPVVYLNFLDPYTALQYEVARNLSIATLGVRHTVHYVALLSLLIPSISDTEIMDTKHCIGLSGGKYLVVTMLFPLFFDTMVYIFISVKLSAIRNPCEKKVSWRMVISDSALPRLSRAVLLGGQQYYLIKIFISVVTSTFWLIPSTPFPLQAAMAVPGVALTSSMACRVYRNLRLQMLEDASQREEADAVFTTCVQAPMSEGLASKDERALYGGDGDPKLDRRSLQIVIETNGTPM
ncbi:hypothetical protein ID866_9337 [Astraeus odoratus]|nr:hypothetical protein ID866_9337 [Astraeus odoratus]